MTARGVLYISHGKVYVKAAIRSAISVRKFNPNLAIHLFTDSAGIEKLAQLQNSNPFSSTGLIENPHRRSKVDYISQTPFDETLYLDSDTSVVADLGDLFGVLERFDIGLSHAMNRNSAYSQTPWKVDLPAAYPQYNGGVIIFRKIPEVIRFLELWGKSFQESGLRHDQPTLRELLWFCDLRIATLPPEYNVRNLKFPIFWSKSEAQAKIYHLKQYHIGWRIWLGKQINFYKWMGRLRRQVVKLGIINSNEREKK